MRVAIELAIALGLSKPFAAGRTHAPRTDDSDHKPVVQPVPGQAVVVRAWATKDQFGTMTSTSFWTQIRAFRSPTPLDTRPVT